MYNQEKQGSFLQNIKTIDELQFSGFKCPFRLIQKPCKMLNRLEKKIYIPEKQQSSINQSKFKYQFIIFDQNNQDIAYIITNRKTLNSQQTHQCIICLNQSQRQNYILRRLEKWVGYKYVKEKQLYYGSFHFFLKHKQGISVNFIDVTNDYFWDKVIKSKNINEGNKKVLKVLKGQFFYDRVHLKLKPQLEPSNEKLVILSQNKIEKIQKAQGYYIDNLRNGKWKIDDVQMHFQNGQYSQKQYQIKPYESKKFDTHFGIQINISCLESLQPNKQLSENIINLFFRGLQQSHRSKSQLYQSYQFMVSQCFIIRSLKENNEFIDHLKGIINNKCYKLMLLPIAIQIYGHFILLGIQTYSITQSAQLQFKIYFMDSLEYMQKDSKDLLQEIEQIIRTCLKKSSKQNNLANKSHQNYISSDKIYTVSSMKFPKQSKKNINDCGIFCCLYGILIYMLVVKNKQIINLNQIKQNIDNIIFNYRLSIKNTINLKQSNFLNKFTTLLKL